MKHSLLLCKMIMVAIFAIDLTVLVSMQCPIAPSTGVRSNEWDNVFTQDGPGKGLEPAGSPGWTGGDSTYSLLLPNGDTAFFFSDSYIAESPRTKGDGTVSRDAFGLRTTELNCFIPICEPAASIFKARNSIVILNRDRTILKTIVGKKEKYGFSTSYFSEPGPGFCYWMGDAILRKGDKRTKDSILVFLHKFDSKLEFHGAAIARLDAESLEIEKQIEIRGLSNNSIHWGTAMVINGQFLYIYGKGIRDGKKQAFVARSNVDSSVEQLSDVSNWKAWNGKTWIEGLENAAAIVPQGDSISDEFNVVRVSIFGRRTYVLAAIDTTIPFGFWKDITLYSSCAPEGPFVGKHVVYTTPESGAFSVPGLTGSARLKEKLVVYNPHIHSQFSAAGRLLISYNINRSHNSDTIYIDGYRPRFISVPIAGLK